MSEFRSRLLAHGLEPLLLNRLLTLCQERGWIKPRGNQRTDSTYLLAKVRDLNRLELVGETMRHAVEVLATVAPAWLRPHLLPEWAESYRITELEEELRRSRAVQLKAGKSAPASPQNVEEIQHLRADLAQARRDLAERDGKIAALQSQIATLEKLTALVNGTHVALTDLPAHLQRLHIDQATITVDQLNGVPGVAAKEPGEATEAANAESASPTIPGRKKPLTVNETLSLLPYSQGLTLRNLLKKVDRLTTNERALFSWLLSNDGIEIRPLDLADAVCINVRATRPDRTAELRRIPFIDHPASTGSYFVATFAAYAVKAFPGASRETVEAVKHCLLYAAR